MGRKSCLTGARWPLCSLPLSLPTLPARASLAVSAAPSRRQRSSRPRHVAAGPEARRLPATPPRRSGPPHPGGEWLPRVRGCALGRPGPGPWGASSGCSLPGLLSRTPPPGPGKGAGLRAAVRQVLEVAGDPRPWTECAGRGASQIGGGPRREKLVGET